MEKIKNIFKNISLLKIIAVIVAVALLIYIPKTISERSIKTNAIPETEVKELSQSLGEISTSSPEMLIASSGGKNMYLNPQNMNVRIEDTETGSVWNTLNFDERATNIEKSPVLIKYMGRDSSIVEWDAYKYSISTGNYSIRRIKNGFAATYSFRETTSSRLNEYIPQKISIERFEKLFLDKIDELAKNGTITSAQAQRYRSSLNLVYAKDTENGCYYNKYSGIPPVTLTSVLIELSKAVGYTREDLIEDSAQYGIAVTIVEPAQFDITVETTLEDGDIVVRVPTSEIKKGNDFYTLQNLAVYPNFGVVSALASDEGYIMVPDGAGALFKINSYNGRYPEYSRPVYNNTYYDTMYEMPKFQENLTMPIFGMAYRNALGNMQGFLGIIEKGAETALINVKLGTKDVSQGGIPFNKVYPSFNTTQYSRVKVFGPYSSNDARFLSTTGLIKADYTVRYKLMGKDTTYFSMAQVYRNYLIEHHGLKVSYSGRPKVFLDVLSALTIKARFLGVPYDKTVSMTTYSELEEILKDLGGIEKVVSYNGMYNGGMFNGMLNKIKAVPENGSKEELERLKSYAKESGTELFFGTNLLRVYKKGGGFNPKIHALRGFDRKSVRIYSYNLPRGIFDEDSRGYYLVSPKYLSSVTEGLINGATDADALYLNDAGNTYYASYNSDELIDPFEASAVLEENLKKLAQNKTVALKNPNINTVFCSKYSTDISRESSDFGTMYVSIPLRQLVMNGLTEYTTLNVNMSTSSPDYYLLQALELGSYPKFTICAKNVDVLKYANFTEYFAVEYSKLADEIKNFCSRYRAEFEKIGTQEIVNHTMLSENVFETTYSSGVKVTVNYNKYPVTIGAETIDALSYRITQ